MGHKVVESDPRGEGGQLPERVAAGGEGPGGHPEGVAQPQQPLRTGWKG